MKIVTCIKGVPSVVTKLGINREGDLECEGSQSITMNEPDEYALEEALSLKRNAGGEVTIVTVGRLRCQQILYVGLAKGADKAIRIDTSFLDSQSVSLLLAEAIKREEYDLILTGAESSDNMAAQVGVALAERLHLPFAFAVTSIETVGPGAIRVTKELGGGLSELLEIRLPALLCIQPGVRPLAYVPARNLLQAQKRQVKCVDLAALGIDESKVRESKKQKVIDFFPPSKLRHAEIIEGMPSEVARVLLEKIKGAM